MNNINTDKIHRTVHTCPLCDSVAYYKKNDKYICYQCKKDFTEPNISLDTNILDFNYYVNAFPTKGFIHLDGLSFGLLEKLNTILEANGSFVNIDFPSFQGKLSMFKNTQSEFSKLQLLKVREDYLDHEDVFSKLTTILLENNVGPLSSGTFDVNIKAPVYLNITDMYDLEQLTYDLSKTDKDGEIEALLDMFTSINKGMNNGK